MWCFCSAKTCSTPDRSRERAAFAHCFGSGIGLPGGLRKWTFETSPALAMRRSFFAERYAVSAQTDDPVFDLSSSPGNSRPW